MKKKVKQVQKIFSKTISFSENSLLPVLYGEHDRYLKLVEEELFVSIMTRGNFLKLSGNKNDVDLAKNLLENLYEDVKKIILWMKES